MCQWLAVVCVRPRQTRSATVSTAGHVDESLTLENAAASLARSLLANPSPLSRALVGVTAP